MVNALGSASGSRPSCGSAAVVQAEPVDAGDDRGQAAQRAGAPAGGRPGGGLGQPWLNCGTAFAGTGMTWVWPKPLNATDTSEACRWCFADRLGSMLTVACRCRIFLAMAL